MSPHLVLNRIGVVLDGNRIVENISFNLDQGQIGSLLGPSGCGKTTLLRTIAGLERPHCGEITLRGQCVASSKRSIAPERRNIGMVFQDIALFPHLTVAQNVGFAIRHYSAQQRQKRVAKLLELVGLSRYLHSYPHQLSGGQQQRIALIRAMAPSPDVLLLDEPFSGQDIGRRESLAKQVGQILRQDGITALLVTHDQFEAFAFADVIGVINGGSLCQWSDAYELYHQPQTRFVADFIGQGVFIRGKVIDHQRLQTGLGVIAGEATGGFAAGTEVDLLVRPDDVLHDDSSVHKGLIEDRSFRGSDHLYTLVLPEVGRLLCLAPSHHNHAIGERIGFRLDVEHLVVFARDH